MSEGCEYVCWGGNVGVGVIMCEDWECVCACTCINVSWMCTPCENGH